MTDPPIKMYFVYYIIIYSCLLLVAQLKLKINMYNFNMYLLVSILLNSDKWIYNKIKKLCKKLN